MGVFNFALVGADEDAGATGDLDITDDLTITGAGGFGPTVVDAMFMDRVFHVLPPPEGESRTVTISHLAMQRGAACLGGAVGNGASLAPCGGDALPALPQPGLTGAPAGKPTLVLASATVQNSVAPLGGGGIANHGTLVLEDSLVRRNEGGTSGGGLGGGGILNVHEAEVYRSEVSENEAFLNGGGISNTGSLVVEASNISDNNVGFSGGGIYSSGSLRILDGRISGNDAGSNQFLPDRGEGGGVFSLADTVITGTTINHNTARGYGAGVASDAGSLSIEASLISSNRAGTTGGGVALGNGGATPAAISAFLENVTLTANVAESRGGGLANGGGISELVTTSLNNVTATANRATDGAGIDNAQGHRLTVSNSVVSANETGGDCAGVITSAGHNLTGDNSCPLGGEGDLSGDPGLAELADNGGLTMTHAVLADSPVVDAGDDGSCAPNDQRGKLRPIDGDGDGVDQCDMGAFEFDPADPTATPAPTPSPTPGALPDAGGPPTAGPSSQSAISLVALIALTLAAIMRVCASG